MQHISVKFVTRFLSKKENRVKISQELPDQCQKNFIKNIITGDEMWVYRYDAETKRQSLQLVGKGSP